MKKVVKFFRKLLEKPHDGAEISEPTELSHDLSVDRNLTWKFNSEPVMRFELLGEGGYSKVYRVEIQGKTFAGKIYDVCDRDFLGKISAQISNEVQALSELMSCNYTVCFYGSTFCGGYNMLLLEYCGKKSLKDIIYNHRSYITDEIICVIVRELVCAVKELQEMSYIHCDIKSSNVLFNDDYELKLCDFSCARRFEEFQDDDDWDDDESRYGSIYWMAPEVCNGSQYIPPSDIWSLGVLAYEMAEGHPLYFDKDKNVALSKIYKDGFCGFKDITRHPTDFVDFVIECLKKDPYERPTIHELEIHPYVVRGSKLDRESVLGELFSKIETSDQGPVPASQVSPNATPTSTNSFPPNCFSTSSAEIKASTFTMMSSLSFEPDSHASFNSSQNNQEANNVAPCEIQATSSLEVPVAS